MPHPIIFDDAPPQVPSTRWAAGCRGRRGSPGAWAGWPWTGPSPRTRIGGRAQRYSCISTYLLCIYSLTQGDPGIEKGVCRTHDWCTAEDGETQGYCIEELSRRVQASPRARTAGGASSCTTARCAAAPGLATPGPPAAPPTTGAPAASGPRPGQ